MGKRLWCLCLVLPLLAHTTGVAAQDVTDPEVARGIKEVEEGDYDAGIFRLDAASRRLAKDPSRALDLCQAYLYLGIGYLGKGHEVSARARFREALGQVKELKLSTDKFAPRVIEVFETAREEMARSAPTASVPSPSPAPAGTKPTAASEKKGGSKKGLVLVGAGVAVAGGMAALAGGGSSSGGAAASSYRLDASDTQPLANHGGSGGTPFQLPCATGSLMSGITGLADSSSVKRAAPGCAILLTDGTTGAKTLLTPPGGASGTPFEDPCPAGQAVVRLHGTASSGGFIRQFGIGCATIRDWVGGVSTVTQLSPRGSGGDLGGWTESCSPGYVVTSLSGGAGSNLDRIAAVCTRVRR